MAETELSEDLTRFEDRDLREVFLPKGFKEEERTGDVRSSKYGFLERPFEALGIEKDSEDYWFESSAVAKSDGLALQKVLETRRKINGDEVVCTTGFGKLLDETFRATFKKGLKLPSEQFGDEAVTKSLTAMRITGCFISGSERALNLRDAHMRGCFLHGCVLASLVNATLIDCTFQDCKWEKPEHKSANKAALERCRFYHTSMERANFSNATLKFVVMVGGPSLNLAESNFQGAQLTKCKFTSCNMQYCSFIPFFDDTSATLHDIDFNDADLSFANFQDCRGIPTCHWTGCDITNARIRVEVARECSPMKMPRLRSQKGAEGVGSALVSALKSFVMWESDGDDDEGHGTDGDEDSDEAENKDESSDIGKGDIELEGTPREKCPLLQETTGHCESTCCASGEKSMFNMLIDKAEGSLVTYLQDDADKAYERAKMMCDQLETNMAKLMKKWDKAKQIKFIALVAACRKWLLNFKFKSKAQSSKAVGAACGMVGLVKFLQHLALAELEGELEKAEQILRNQGSLEAQSAFVDRLLKQSTGFELNGFKSAIRNVLLTSPASLIRAEKELERLHDDLKILTQTLLPDTWKDVLDTWEIFYKMCEDLRTEKAQMIAHEIWQDIELRKKIAFCMQMKATDGQGPAGILAVMRDIQKAVKHYQNKFISAVEKELRQIHRIKSYKQMLWTGLTNAILSIMITVGNYYVYTTNSRAEEPSLNQ